MKAFRISPNSALSFWSLVLALVLAMIFTPAPGMCGTLSDDFEDGAVGSWWYVYDGSVTDADESGGALHLAGPDPEAELFGDVISLGQVEYLTGDVTLTATFEAINPGENTIYGIYLGKTNADEFHDATIISVWHDATDGTMVSFDDEDVYAAVNGYGDPEGQSIIIGDISAYGTVTLVLHKTGGAVTGWYKLGAGSFIQIGASPNNMTDPFTVLAFGDEWPPPALGTTAYDFSVLDFEVTGPNVPDMLAGGGPDTFTDDFEDPATYLGVAPTKWRQVDVASGTFSSDLGSGGTGLSVRLTDLNPAYGAPAMGANHAQYYDLSSVVLEAEVRHNPSSEFGPYYGGGGIGFGVYNDTGEDLCGGIAAQLWYDAYWSTWVFSLFDTNEYDTETYSMGYLPLPANPLSEDYFDPTQFHKIRMERVGEYVSATLDRKWTLTGIPRLPIDVAGLGVFAQDWASGGPADFSFDNFTINAQPDNRHMVFGNVEILEDTAADELFPSWSKDGKWLAFIRDEMDTGPWNVWVQQIDPSGDAVKRTSNSDNVFMYPKPVFSPDNSHVIFTVLHLPSAEYPIGAYEVKRATVSGPLVVDTILPLEGGFGYESGDLSRQGNILIGLKQSMTAIQGNIYAIEVNDDGSIDPVTQEKMLTNFAPGTARPYDPHFDATGDRIVFMSYVAPPTDMDLYMLSGVQEILNGIKPPPTDYNDYPDERLTLLAGGPNAQATGRFSGDGSLVYYCEDRNAAYNFEAPVFNPLWPWETVMSGAHFEIFAVNPDAPEEKIKLNYYRPYNQGILAASPDGTKLAFISDNHDDGTPEVVDADIYIVTLATQGSIVAEDGGEIDDGSGSGLDIPADSISEDAVITIQTPFPGDIPSPETLPGGLQNIALARVIEAEPPTATIDPDNPPILTIHYTDEEISGLDEMSLRIYVFNDEADPAFWEAIPMDCDVCGVDPVANTVKGTLTHLSTFCVSGALEGTLPVVGSFKPPLTDETDFTLQYGTTLPVKFDIRTPAGAFLPDEPIKAVVTDSSANKIVTFVRGTGSEDIRADTVAEHYIFNLHSKDYGLVDGATYTIIILWNSIPIGDIDFVVDYTKGTGRGKKK